MYKTPKDFLSGSENILKNFTIEILRQCVRESIVLKPEVVSFAVGLYCLDPQHEIALDIGNNPKDVEAFTRKMTKKLIALDSSVKTMEMQVVFMEKMQNVENIKTIYEKRLSEKTEAIQEEILEFKADNIQQQDELFEYIVMDMIANNKLGKPTNEKVFRETSNALKSVFSRTDLAEFCLAKRKRRMELLDHLRKLVCGIRLFNKDAGHCGEGVRNIIEDVSLGFKNTKLALTHAMTECNNRINSITNVLKEVFRCENILEILGTIDVDDYEHLRDILMIYSQQRVYLSALLETLNQSKRSMDTFFVVFRNEINNVHEIVKFRIAIEAEKVFPHFVRLHKLWSSLMTYLYAFVEINQLNDQMKILTDSEFEQDTLNSLSAALKDKRKKINCSESVRISNPECKILKSNESINKPTTRYCAYLFVVGGGILIPSQPSFGILQYKNYYFAFSQAVYANWFSEDIGSYSQKFFEIVRTIPPLIVLFDCFDKIVEIRSQKKVEAESTVDKIKTVEVQTELHPIPYYKDKNYTWNIWDLRRKAIQLANIKNSKTHSTQTDVSYHRMAVRLQTVGLKEESDQTMRTTSTTTKAEEENEKEVAEKSATLARVTKCLWK